jgi:cell division protein FtsB
VASQNQRSTKIPASKPLLKETEDGLRLRGILPPLEKRVVSEGELPALRDAGKQRAMRDNERLKRLEQENASLHAENAELKRQLQRFTVLQEALALTGRLPR